MNWKEKDRLKKMKQYGLCVRTEEWQTFLFLTKPVPFLSVLSPSPIITWSRRMIIIHMLVDRGRSWSFFPDHRSVLWSFQGFLPCLFLLFRSIHLHIFQNFSWFLPVLDVANTGSCVGPQNKIGHPAGCRFPCLEPTEYKKAKEKTWLVVSWLVKWITVRQNEVCVQPWCIPLWLTGLKAPAN